MIFQNCVFGHETKGIAVCEEKGWEIFPSECVHCGEFRESSKTIPIQRPGNKALRGAPVRDDCPDKEA